MDKQTSSEPGCPRDLKSLDDTIQSLELVTVEPDPIQR